MIDGEKDIENDEHYHDLIMSRFLIMEKKLT